MRERRDHAHISFCVPLFTTYASCCSGARCVLRSPGATGHRGNISTNDSVDNMVGGLGGNVTVHAFPPLSRRALILDSAGAYCGCRGRWFMSTIMMKDGG